MTTIPWKPSGPETEPTTPSSYIKYYNPTDVLMGRGTPSVRHPGNVFFRCLVDDCKDEYMRSESNADKDVLARRIVDLVASKGGRFLSKVEFQSKTEPDGLGLPKEMKPAWILAPEEVVLTKVKQCMRDLFKRTSQHVNQEHHKPRSSGTIKPVESKIQVSELRNLAPNSTKTPSPVSLPFSLLPTMSQRPSTTAQIQSTRSAAAMRDVALWPLVQQEQQQQQLQEVSDRVRAIVSQYANLGVNQTAAAQALLRNRQGLGSSVADVESMDASGAHAPDSTYGWNSSSRNPAFDNHQEAALLLVLLRGLASSHSPAGSYPEINQLHQSNPTELTLRQVEPWVPAMRLPMFSSEEALMALLLQQHNGIYSLHPSDASARANDLCQFHQQSTQESALHRYPHSTLFGPQLPSLLSHLTNNTAQSVPLSPQAAVVSSPEDRHPINTMMAEMLMNSSLGLPVASTERRSKQGEERKRRRKEKEEEEEEQSSDHDGNTKPRAT